VVATVRSDAVGLWTVTFSVEGAARGFRHALVQTDRCTHPGADGDRTPAEPRPAGPRLDTARQLRRAVRTAAAAPASGGSVVAQAYVKMIGEVPESSLGLRPGLHGEASVTAEKATQLLRDTLGETWMGDALRRRQQMYARFRRWTEKVRLPQDAGSAAFFVVAPGVDKPGQLAYVRLLSGTLRRMGLDVQPLRDLGQTLVAQGAQVPATQAAPVPRGPLCQFVCDAWRNKRWTLGLVVLLCWVTASRWSDVVRLRRRQFVLLEKDEVIIDWFTSTKGRRANPYRPSRYVVIRGQFAQPIAQTVRFLGQFDPLSAMSTSRLNAQWAETDDLTGFTASGIKAGARTHLDRLRADGRLQDVSVHIVNRLMKHSTPSDPMNGVGLRYGRDKVAQARMLETGTVTPLM
jgi:hypothetical protein